uniref:PHP domain-containing protein n=1 Tax=Bacillus altitudinis TaxID=293387 RepID=UPI0011A13594
SRKERTFLSHPIPFYNQTITLHETSRLSISYLHLHLHTPYTFFTTAPKLNHLLLNPKQLPYQPLPLTHHHLIYPTLEFYNQSKTHPIKPIIPLTPSLFIHQQHTHPYPFILLPKNNQPYQNFIKITTLFKSNSKTPLKDKCLKAYHHDLIAITPRLSGYSETLL